MEKFKYRQRYEFLEFLPKNTIGAELGVLKGEFSGDFIKVINPKKFYLIDTWWTSGLNRNWTIDAVCEILQLYRNSFLKNQTILKIGSDLDILPQFEDNYFDWAYIDSSHACNHTRSELAILRKKVKDDGYILGHDWNEDPIHSHHGVCKAVREFMEKENYELLFLDNFGQWCIKRR